MKDLHLNVNDAAFEIINNKKLLNKYSYSKAVEELVFNAQINNELITEFQKVSLCPSLLGVRNYNQNKLH